MAKVTYFLQRADDRQVWEEVDQHVWDNVSKVVMKDSTTPRYTGNGIIKTDDKIDIRASLDVKELGIVCRFLNVQPEREARRDGFHQTPDYVKIRRGKNASVYEIGSAEATKKEVVSEERVQVPAQIMGVNVERRAS